MSILESTMSYRSFSLVHPSTFATLLRQKKRTTGKLKSYKIRYVYPPPSLFLVKNADGDRWRLKLYRPFEFHHVMLISCFVFIKETRVVSLLYSVRKSRIDPTPSPPPFNLCAFNFRLNKASICLKKWKKWFRLFSSHGLATSFWYSSFISFSGNTEDHTFSHGEKENFNITNSH